MLRCFAAVRTGVKRRVKVVVRAVCGLAVEPLELALTAWALAPKEAIVVKR